MDENLFLPNLRNVKLEIDFNESLVHPCGQIIH